LPPHANIFAQRSLRVSEYSSCAADLLDTNDLNP
jgi:hypothetical protein